MRMQRNFRPTLDGALEGRIALTTTAAALHTALTAQQAVALNAQNFHAATPTVLTTAARFIPTYTLGPVSGPNLSGSTTVSRAVTSTLASVKTATSTLASVKTATSTLASVKSAVGTGLSAASNLLGTSGLSNLSSSLGSTAARTLTSGVQSTAGLLGGVGGTGAGLFIPLPSLGTTSVSTSLPSTTNVSTIAGVPFASNGTGLSFTSGVNSGINLGSTALAGLGLGTTGSSLGNLFGTSTFGSGMFF